MANTTSKKHRKRYLLLSAQDWRCFWCQCGITWETSTFDHLIPQAHGGKRGQNIVLTCDPCNKERSRITSAHTDLSSRGLAAVKAGRGDWFASRFARRLAELRPVLNKFARLYGGLRGEIKEACLAELDDLERFREILEEVRVQYGR